MSRPNLVLPWTDLVGSWELRRAASEAAAGSLGLDYLRCTNAESRSLVATHVERQPCLESQGCRRYSTLNSSLASDWFRSNAVIVRMMFGFS